MNILIAIHEASTANSVLRYATQFAHFGDESSLVLALINNAKRPWLTENLVKDARDQLGLPNLAIHQRTGDPVREIIT
jgi:hypothetical protein